jgi:hypothetical protein
MALESLKDAIGTISRMPVLWISGGATGILSSLDLLAPLYLDAFITGRLWLLQALILPFIIGGAFGVIKENDGRLAVFFRSGFRYYWSVLLPVLILGFAALITLFLVVLPLSVIGIPLVTQIVTMVTLGITVPFAFFSFFYDAAAVFEERKIFDSIRRSIEFIITNAFKSVLFFVISVLLSLLVAFPAFFAWTLLLADQLEWLIDLSASEIQALTPQGVVMQLGPQAILITAVIFFAAMLLIGTLLIAYKACFFRRHADQQSALPGQASPQTQGEYDAKGRWYKY